MSILADHDAFLSIKQESRVLYIKNWEKFKSFSTDFNDEEEKPSEEMDQTLANRRKKCFKLNLDQIFNTEWDR